MVLLAMPMPAWAQVTVIAVLSSAYDVVDPGPRGVDGTKKTDILVRPVKSRTLSLVRLQSSDRFDERAKLQTG